MKRWLWSNWLGLKGWKINSRKRVRMIETTERERKKENRKEKKILGWKREEPYRGELRVDRNVHKESRKKIEKKKKKRVKNIFKKRKFLFKLSRRTRIPGGFLSLFLSFSPSLTVDSRLGWLTESRVRWHNRRSHWYRRPVGTPGAKQSSNRRIHRLIFLVPLFFFFSTNSFSCMHTVLETIGGPLCQFGGGVS